ncbi:MAG: FAD-dependent oxidoreductase [Hydrogenophaga sp.]|uniref:NAD(P)/FAD-dependent oxidoreductase n=1 Tax=Hydrogenophaga sp. TaxID=1904254 RepID=UPI0016B28501|nr:FAD-dependent oxidoreductase [Hydrogenophaga sp.]NIM44010.1 FAD-dependent oxidoreductase [Hydrogenophaga sp.]NIN29071.1 FAD-dependent oxidoreductase [Hydrogenophaga sp.]NIN33548.1 FAD-dependent oxidoreductase [Hydrogenophaga sp.]NIN58213.1 FAD-dependent oxidoreductase [Hydrogenophaga sp.]NIO54511.1 FAD-dependent oxidoreductase [Hydrogenophaga sp.]
MKPAVIVLGAGMVGVCTALHLRQRGHEVTLVDRREPGRETSYGNAGIVQREAVEPYAFPRDWAMLARVAMKRGADVNYHLGALPALAGPLSRYWWHSRPASHRRIARDYARLIEHCLSEHEPLIEQAGAQDLVRQEGYRFVFRASASLREGLADARRLAAEYGVRHSELDADALAQAEPGLRQRLSGAIHWLDPWTVSDPGELVARYAALLREQGARVLQGDAASLSATATGWRVRTAEGEIDAPHAVVALGPWSDALLRTLGYRYPLFVKRGYHRHYTGGEPPRLPMLDADGGLVIVPMRQGVRITTGAEFARIDAPPTPVQLPRAHALASELFELPRPVEPQPWMGARPCTADMLPVIGAAPRHRGLWFNFGHAHQGFTLGPVSGRLLAELIGGAEPVVDPLPYAPTRFH